MTLRSIASMSLVAGCLLAAQSGAQQIRGTVVETSTRTTVVGAVVSIIDSAGRSLASVTSDTAGRYSIRWLQGAVSLRVVRLGFRPGVGTLPGMEPRDAEVRLQVDRIPQMLAEVRVNGQMLCPDSRDRRSTLAVWEQARAGLLATIVARQTLRATVVAMNYDRMLDAQSHRVRQIQTRVVSGISSRPFVAARSVDAFERNGFAETQGNERIWFAPDADVLLDERFARSHCFGVRSADDAHPGQFGLTFAPLEANPRSGRVDVEGTLWIDPTRNALTHLEFSFTGPQTSVGSVKAAGALEFVTAPNGATFISKWDMTFPGSAREARPSASPIVANRFQSGGLVVSAVWPDGASWRSPIPPLAGRITEVGTGQPLAGAIVTLAGWSDSVAAGFDGAFVLPVLPLGEYRLIATDTTLSRFLRPRSADRVVVAGAARVIVNIEIEGATAGLRELCKDLGLQNSVTVLGRLVRDRGVPGELTVDADWESKIKLGPDGVSFNGNRRTFVLDDQDRFAVCGVEPGRAVQLDLYLLGRPVTDTVVTVGKQEATHEFDWIISSAALTNAARAAATSLVATIVDDRTGDPIEGVEAWVVLAGEQFKSGSTGRVEANGLKAGRHVIQLRRLGYAVVRDTFTLRFGATTTRQFRMASLAQTLDTVTTVSSGVQYSSPLLRGFEDRRATGVGRYVSEAELRGLDGEIAGWLKVFQKIPGTRVVNGTSGEHVESTRGSGSIMIKSLRPADPGDRRSPRGCWISVYLDAVPLNRDNSQRAPDLRLLRTEQFAGVEYYGSNAAIPAQFSGVRPNECGVLLLWTRER